VQAESPGRAAPSTSLRVLVAEDDRISQMYMRQQLARLGHTAFIVANGQEALEALQNAAFDCVLMDVQMPVMDGLEATRAIRGLPAPVGEIPIVAVTANAAPEELAACRAAGMDDLVAKPIDTAQLLAAIGRAIAGRNL
jgi:CheY-like chemotaxis protein